MNGIQRLEASSKSILKLPIACAITLFVFTGVLFAAKPNILLIQVDDLGFDDLGLHGNPHLQTPHLDRLGRESVRFDRFYLQALCAPSRAALLTDRHFWRTGVSGVHAGRDYLHLEEILLSELLQANGYATGLWGKWHSGKTHGYLPWDRGFDEAYYDSLYNYWDNTGLLNGRGHSTKGYVTDRITDMAMDFIRRNRSNLSSPTFLTWLRTIPGGHLKPSSTVTGRWGSATPWQPSMP